jgi:hypothetical protein
LLSCLAAANAEARGGSHGSAMRSLGHPAGKSVTVPMPGQSTFPGAPAGSTARANALVNADPVRHGGRVFTKPRAFAGRRRAGGGRCIGRRAGATATACWRARERRRSGGRYRTPTTTPVTGPAAPTTPEPALPALAPMSDPFGDVPLQSQRVGAEQPGRRWQIAQGLHGLLGCGHPHDKTRVARRLQTFDGGVSRRQVVAAVARVGRLIKRAA